MKICNKCERKKSDFAKGHSECKECNKNYRLANKERIKNNNAEYYLNNKEKLNDKNKEYQSNNAEVLKNYRKEYRLLNKSSTNEYNKKYRKNKYDNDPVFRLRVITSSSIFQHLKKTNKTKNNKSIVHYLGYSFFQLKEHIEKQFEPWMTWNNYGKYNVTVWKDGDTSTWTWQIDHIIPQSELPYFSMEDLNFKKCWSLDNLRPLSAKRNVEDGNRR